MSFSNPPGYITLGGPSVEQQQKQHIQRLEGQIAALHKEPLAILTVLAVTSAGRGVLAGAPPIEISIPEGAKVGSQVRCVPQKPNAFTLLPEPVSFGQVATVVSLHGATATVKAAFETLAAVAEGLELAAGDRVALDPSGTVILKRLESSSSFAAAPQKVSWDDIGGQEEAKEALREAIEYPVRYAEVYAAHGQKAAKGALLYGPPGCVDGEAIVTVNRGGIARRMRLRDLVERFNQGGAKAVDLQRSDWAHASNGAGRCVKCGQRFPCARQRRRDASPGGRSYAWDPSIPTMIRCFAHGEFRLRRVVAAYPKGTRSVLRVTLADGKVLRVTPDHEIAQPGDAWTPAEKLQPGALVLTNGLAAPTASEHGHTRYLHKGYWILCSGLSKHPRARKTSHGGYELPEHRLAAEARENGKSLAEWLQAIARGDFAPDAVFLSSEQEVHHDDRDTTNNAPSNLIIKTKLDHLREHAIEDRWHRHLPVFLAKETAVVSVEPDGETEVFDLTVEEAHNFVANGVVVHNCGKTILGKALATSLSGDASGFLYVKATEVMSKWQGESGGTVRALFRQGREYQAKTGTRAVLFLDEADSLLPVRDGSSVKVGGGVEDMVPVFLAEMDGLDELGPFVLLATNRPDRIDPAVLRDGRCDAKVHVSRPTREDCLAIFRLALRGRCVNPMNLDSVVEYCVEQLFSDRLILLELTYPGVRTSEYLRLRDLVSGAMIEGIVQRAAGLAIKRDREAEHGIPSTLSRDDIEQAIKLTLRQQARVNHDAVIADISRAFGKNPERVRKVIDG